MNNHRRSPDLVPEKSDAPVRAALYMRVSTGRQAEHDLSIPDQRSQLQSWCRGNGHPVVAEYVEAGASAGDDRRPSFQQMIERACDGEHAFDLIVVSIATAVSFARPSSRNSTSASLPSMPSGSFP